MEHMRDRVCPGVSGLSVLAQSLGLCRPLLTEKSQQRWMLPGSSRGPRTNPACCEWRPDACKLQLWGRPPSQGVSG